MASQLARRQPHATRQLPWPWRVVPLLAWQVGDHTLRPCLQTVSFPEIGIPSPGHRTKMWKKITKLARQAGLTATTEQAMLIPDHVMPEGQPAPGSIRPIHRADIHFVEPQGSELWLDVKIQPSGAGKRDDARGPGAIWLHCPRGAGHFQQDHKPLHTNPCPTRHAILAWKEGRQLRAVGPHFKFLA